MKPPRVNKVNLKALDFLVFALVLTTLGYLSITIYGNRDGTATARIRGGNQEWVLPLDLESNLTVVGPLGETLIEIREGKIRVVDSPCPEKICIKTGAISKPGQWIACLPNKVFISVGGSREEADAFSF